MSVHHADNYNNNNPVLLLQLSLPRQPQHKNNSARQQQKTLRREKRSNHELARALTNTPMNQPQLDSSLIPPGYLSSCESSL